MIHDILQPETSPDFTIDDIHRIREWNYKKLNDATPEERVEYYRDKTHRFEARTERVRRMGV